MAEALAAPAGRGVGGGEKGGALPLEAAGEGADEFRLPLHAGEAFFLQLVDERVADESGFEPGVLENGLLEGEEAEHFIEQADHFRDAALVPCPDLRADVVNDAGLG